MARMFTVTNQDGKGSEEHYKGFDRRFEPLSQLDRIAVVVTDGEVDLYAMDGKECKWAATELIRFLSDRGENSKVAGIYSRE